MNTGIYKIENTVNGNFYIGSTKMGFAKRKNEHLRTLRKGIHHSVILQHAYNKYGEEALEFKIIERLEPDVCREVEQKYLDELNPHYNVSTNACGGNGQFNKEQINAIFDSYIKTGVRTETAKEFGVSPSLISMIINRKSYTYFEVSSNKIKKAQDIVNANVITDQQAGQIKWLLSEGAVGLSIGKHFGVNSTLVSRINYSFPPYDNIKPTPCSQILLGLAPKKEYIQAMFSEKQVGQIRWLLSKNYTGRSIAKYFKSPETTITDVKNLKGGYKKEVPLVDCSDIEHHMRLQRTYKSVKAVIDGRIKIFNSASQAAKYLGKDDAFSSNIKRSIRTGMKAMGYHWEHA